MEPYIECIGALQNGGFGLVKVMNVHRQVKPCTRYFASSSWFEVGI